EAKSAPTAGVSNAQANKQLGVLADQYYIALARFDPVSATESGDGRFDDQIGLSLSPKLRARQFALYRGYQQRLTTIRRELLDQRRQTSYDILAYELKTA